MADQLALFGIVVGIALLLSGIGFIVLAAFGMVRVTATDGRPARGACDVDLTGRGLTRARPSAGRPQEPGRPARRSSGSADLDDAVLERVAHELGSAS